MNCIPKQVETSLEKLHKKVILYTVNKFHYNTLVIIQQKPKAE